MAKTRDFGSLEQALLHALKDLTDEDLAATKKKKEDLRRYSDPAKPDRQIPHVDSIAFLKLAIFSSTSLIAL